MAYFRHTSNYTPSWNNTFHLQKSAVCYVAIQNYSSNYMNRCSIITITSTSTREKVVCSHDIHVNK